MKGVIPHITYSAIWSTLLITVDAKKLLGTLVYLTLSNPDLSKWGLIVGIILGSNTGEKVLSYAFLQICSTEMLSCCMLPHLLPYPGTLQDQFKNMTHICWSWWTVVLKSTNSVIHAKVLPHYFDESPLFYPLMLFRWLEAKTSFQRGQ